MRVVGVDGYPKGWVAVLLVDGRFEGARLFPGFGDVLAAYPEAAAIGVDIPIGLPERGRRAADCAARDFVKGRRSSVFWTPPRAALDAGSHREAVERCRELGAPGVSAQAYALLGKIREVAKHVRPNVHEVHPEVSFCAMAGAPLDAPKRSWRGLMHRRWLLANVGVELPDDLAGVDEAVADDVLDAAAAAWSADRIARKIAGTLPDPFDAREPAIWY